MTYLSLLTAAGHRLMVDPKRQRRLFWSLQDAQIAEGRLREKRLSYESYRLKRGMAQEAASISIARSVKIQLDRLDDAVFKELDAGILVLAKHPDTASSKPKHYRWFLDDLRRAMVGEFPILYTISKTGTGLNIMNIGFRQWAEKGKAERRRAGGEATPPIRGKRHTEKKTVPTLKRTERFIAYAGETPDELFAYPPEGQKDALVQAFREGIRQKAQEKGDKVLTDVERCVLAVTALEQEVNNGGFDQFFRNESRKFAAIVVQSLRRIGCQDEAQITEAAFTALRSRTIDQQAIEAAMSRDDPDRDGELERCDQLFYRTQKGMAGRLYDFMKAHREQMSFP